MKIKQVEELVGITRKNIRFYEDQGLLNVERAENGYREYHQADVIRLQEIKLFRKKDSVDFIKPSSCTSIESLSRIASPP